LSKSTRFSQPKVGTHWQMEKENNAKDGSDFVQERRILHYQRKRSVARVKPEPSAALAQTGSQLLDAWG